MIKPTQIYIYINILSIYIYIYYIIYIFYIWIYEQKCGLSFNCPKSPKMWTSQPVHFSYVADQSPARSSFAKSPAPRGPMFSDVQNKRETCDTLQLKTYCSKSSGCVFTVGFRMKITTLMILLGPTTGPFAPKTLRRSLVQWERHDWQDTIHDTMKGSDWTIGCAVRRSVYLRILVKKRIPSSWF